MAQFQFQNDELEYVDNFFDMIDFDDELLAFSESSSSPMSNCSNNDPFDSDFEDDFDIVSFIRLICVRFFVLSFNLIIFDDLTFFL